MVNSILVLRKIEQGLMVNK